jgi:hypothetical protein
MYLVVVCNCCLKYWLIFYMLNIHGTYNVWLCVVYEILLNWLAPSVTNLLLNYKYLESMWLQYCNRLLHTCHENIYSFLTTYLIRYCYECVCACVCARYSCVINQCPLECDSMQHGIFVPVFQTNMMQAAGSCRI